MVEWWSRSISSSTVYSTTVHAASQQQQQQQHNAFMYQAASLSRLETGPLTFNNNNNHRITIPPHVKQEIDRVTLNSYFDVKGYDNYVIAVSYSRWCWFRVLVSE